MKSKVVLDVDTFGDFCRQSKDERCPQLIYTRFGTTSFCTAFFLELVENDAGRSLRCDACIKSAKPVEEQEHD